ncbi:U-box domain-containing protein [Actinidia chinensis var. chinensis]|uniref:U-box domain-containing protein n=1 Tax=Actinidia chinensis var. chinensis TaxID=1590841 RepID=A0A2R6Q2J1_ACTCC|nr:U-box domain-containing protein [Actinidia chinensis var. chinensis]
MTKCHRNDVGSLLLERSGGNSRLWATFSGASFRRIVIDAVRCGGSFRHDDDDNVQSPESPSRSEKKKKNGGSEKLSELLRLSESSDGGEAAAVEVRRKVAALEEMKVVVRRLQCDDFLAGAVDVRRLAKENAEARTSLALLGAIPTLVALLDLEDVEPQIASLYALLNLGIGNYANKAAIVTAGALHKMLKLIESPNGSPNPAVVEAVVANFLALSALDSNKPIIGSSGAVPFLVKTLKDLDKTSNAQSKQDSLRALYNLSISHLNITLILETDLVPFLLSALGDMVVSERILSILTNIVSTPEGRKAVSTVPDAIPVLVDVLNWTDSPGCQEKGSYVLMVMAHKSYGDRQAMIEAGIVSSLLELTLLGSTLAQKRASRILECLRVDKGKQVSESFGGNAVSAPICGSSSTSADPNLQFKECLEEDEDMMSEEKKAVKQLVQQSLQNNMRRIVKRANLPQDFVPSDHLKSLTSSSTSKSLPF